MYTRLKNKRRENVPHSPKDDPRAQLPEGRPGELRFHWRYPITLDIEYKLLITGSVERIGVGKALNASSGGILFETDDALPVRSLVEVLMDWPLLKEGVGSLKLVMRGRVVRTDSKLVAVRVSRYKFRIVADACRRFVRPKS
jgi:hypothetical protein